MSLLSAGPMSLLLWTYEGSNDERKSAEDGRQHTHAGDAFYDDARGGPLLRGATEKIDFSGRPLRQKLT